MSGDYVVIGGGLAGAKAVETLRAEGFAGRIVLVTAESHRPYERPPLSKGYLLGKEPRDKAFVDGSDWYVQNGVELRTDTRAVRIDRDAHQVELSTGERVGYAKLLLATGSSPRKLGVPGADLDGVHYLRTLGDSDRLRSALVPGARVVVIGAGWIGLEVAAAAQTLGATTTVVETDRLPLRRVLGDEVARTFVYLHQANGVTFNFGTGVQRIIGDGKVRAVELTTGVEVPADVVVVGIGITPNVELAEAAGLEISNGVVTDESLRTSDPDIYACGDVASYWHPLLKTRIRVEHWSNALNGGKAAGQAMLGQPVSYDRLPYFYTDQYDLGMEYSGYVEPGGYDSVVFRGDPSVVDAKAPQFLVFWVREGRVLAGMNVNIWDVHEDIKAVVHAGLSGRTVDAGRLADPNVPLADLV